VDSDRLPPSVLKDAGIRLTPMGIRPREGTIYTADWSGIQAILRSLPRSAGMSAAGHAESVEWLHAHLTRLNSLGFPAPLPLPAFDGKSWMSHAATLWELVSFLPGKAVGWSAEPTMERIGEFLGRYHVVAGQIDVTTQRPGALPLSEVPRVLLETDFGRLRIQRDHAGQIRRLAEQLARDLSHNDALTCNRLVIHGDFTNDNVLASGVPPRPTGVIDFALAHLETPLADVGYALWRSGRPDEYAGRLDLARARRYMRGYASTVPVSAAQAHAIPIYLMGRGLQMIAKRVRTDRPEIGMLKEVQWLSANGPVIGDALEAALP
jgi:Ser/Thr protein kinase RdoA (MazF antagonist)